MYEQLLLLRTQVRMVWQHRWTVLLVASLVCLGGWAWVTALPNEYKVTTKVFLDTRSMLKPLLRGLALDTNVREQTMSMVRRTLLSRPNVESIARTTDLDLTAKTPEEFELLIKNLTKDVRIAGGLKQNVFTIAYMHEDPQVALRVVEAFLNIFVERSLGESRKDTSKTRQFLEQQIKEYEARLAGAEDRLKEFKRKNVGRLPGQDKNYYQMREQAAAQLSEAKLRLQELMNKRDELRRQVEGEEPSFGLGGYDPRRVGGPYAVRIAKLEDTLDQLLINYTDRHPDVVATRRLISELEKQDEEYAASLDEAEEVPSELRENPVYQNLKVALGNTEAEVAAMQARVKEFERRQEELGGMIDTILSVEQELKSLDRDYNLNKKNYQVLISRRESLRLSDDADKSTDQVQFNIIEPPRVPLHPSGPDRPKLTALVLGMGLAVGVGLAWLFSMVRPSFYNRDDLAAVTDFPVIGSIARILTPRERLKRRVGYGVYFTGFLGLLSGFGLLLTLQLLHVDLMERLLNLVP